MGSLVICQVHFCYLKKCFLNCYWICSVQFVCLHLVGTGRFSGKLMVSKIYSLPKIHNITNTQILRCVSMQLHLKPLTFRPPGFNLKLLFSFFVNKCKHLTSYQLLKSMNTVTQEGRHTYKYYYICNFCEECISQSSHCKQHNSHWRAIYMQSL